MQLPIRAANMSSKGKYNKNLQNNLRENGEKDEKPDH